MRHFLLPSRVFESNLPKLLCDVATLDQEEEGIVLDLRGVQYWIPAAIVFMCAAVNRWMERGRDVFFDNHENCPACGYLQRMDFFDHIGLQLPERFVRHDPGTSFVEIQPVQPGIARLSDPVARRLAECLAGTCDAGDDVLRFSEYALGEIIGNCQQHAGKPGYVTAQYVAAKDWARAGMADYGIGIRESFRRAGSPHYRKGMTDAEALELAMTPWVSSKRHIKTGPYGESPNRGVGLNMIQHMLANSFGELFLASGNAWRRYEANQPPRAGVLPCAATIPGTVISIRFDRGQVAGYRDILASAQQAMNLLPDKADDIFFS
jgi:hypothetical protein